MQYKTTAGANAWKNQSTPGAKLFSLRTRTMTPASPLPFGTLDLDPRPCIVAGPPRRIRCYVRGCKELLRPPEKGYGGEICPVHGIRCHTSGTYSYDDVRRNIIVDADLVAERLVGHPFKYETDRLVGENSEDTLTWNVFRSLQKAGCLNVLAEQITGRAIRAEPKLYLWGLSLTDNTLELWDLLKAARKRFESNLPVERPLTEPDIALHLPGYYLILIEAKFTSSNPFYVDGPRKDAKSLTKDELLDIYQDSALYILDVEKARRAERVYYQLWRNMVFAEWMALADGKGTQAYHANLTMAGEENESCEHFNRLINLLFDGRFVHLSWQEICFLITESPEFSGLRRYLETKTTGLVRVFTFSQCRGCECRERI